MIAAFNRWRYRRRVEANIDVLHTLTDGEQWFGYDLSRRTRLRPARLYPVLDRLLSWGYIEDDWQDAATHVHPRRWYRITDEGRFAAMIAPVLYAEHSQTADGQEKS